MTPDIFGLNGKTALVIGAGQGIGEAVVLALAGAGCNVALVDNAGDRAEAVAAKVGELGRKATVSVADILDDPQIDRVVAEAEQAFGGVDVLVTVVGSAAFHPLLETTAEQWDFEQRINLRYAFLVGKAFAAACIRREKPGVATFISSVSGIMAATRHAPYGAAKAGLIHLVKTMAVEWAQFDIRVNSIAPGPIITPRLPDTAEWRAQVEQSPLPMQRRGRVKEIANSVLYLSSDLASYVTGQTLAVDGGLTAANIMAVPPRLKARQQ